MAKASRTKTRTPGVFKVGERFEWISYRAGKSGTCDTYAAACDAKHAADSAGPLPERARGQFGAYAIAWIEGYGGRTRRGFSEASRQRYREGLELYAIPFFDRKRPRRFGDVRRADVKAFVTWLERHEARAGKPLTSSTIERTLAPLTAMYSDAIEEGDYKGAHPTAGVRANVRADAIDVDADDNEKRALTVGQLGRVLAAAGRHDYTGDDELVLALLADTGIRWGEFVELRGRDLKTTRSGPVLAVRRAWDAKTRTVGRPKGGQVREVPLPPELVRRLVRLQRKPNELLFTSPRGERLHYQNTLRRMLEPILEAASAPDEDDVTDDVTWAAFHTFRHTFATLLVDAGANVKRVSKMLGHHKASFTLDYYAHLFADDLGPTIDVGGLVAAHRAEAEGAGEGQVEVSKPPETARNAESPESADLQGLHGIAAS